MATVEVEFPVGRDETDACLAALREPTGTLVAKRPQFHDATRHVKTAPGTVINPMQWDSPADFIAFRDANQALIAPAIDHFGPRGRLLTVAA